MSVVSAGTCIWRWLGDKTATTSPPTPSVDILQSDRYNDDEGVWVRPDGKIHGPIPGAHQIEDEDLESSVSALKDSLRTRREENDRYPRGNPNGDEEDQRNWERYRAHADRIDEEQKLLEKLLQRLRILEDY